MNEINEAEYLAKKTEALLDLVKRVQGFLDSIIAMAEESVEKTSALLKD